MKLKKKIASVALLLCMLVTMIPTTILAENTSLTDVYVELVEQGTENLFEGAELISAYYAGQEDVKIPFEKVSEGKYKLSLDVALYGDEFAVCEFEFPDGYRQVGYDMEPIGKWVDQWANSQESYVIEVCNVANGSGTETFTVWDEDHNLLDGTDITVYLYQDTWEFETEVVELATTTNGEITFDYEYQNGNFVYNGKEYKDLLIMVKYPFGYTTLGKDLSTEYYAYETRWYTVPDLVGHTWDILDAVQYLEDVSMTQKDVYIKFVDETNAPFADITAENVIYSINGTEEVDVEVVSQGDGVFKLTLDGKTYMNQTIWAFFNCPDGYVFEGTDETAFSDYVDRWFYTGETQTIKVVKQQEESSAKTEMIRYEILDENGNALADSTIKVWLSDIVAQGAEKTLIYEAVNGSGEIPITYTDTEFVYNGENYNFIIYECSFPNGYKAYYEPANGYIGGINKYYNVTDLEKTGFEWSWILEKEEEEKVEKPIKPEVPVEPEAPVKPEKPTEPETEDESNKLVGEMLEQIKKEEGNHVEIISQEPDKMDKNIFDSMKEHKKDISIGVKDKEGKRVEYSWTFSDKTLTNTNMEIDIEITFGDGKKAEIKEQIGKDDIFCIYFSHHGELPGPATIKNYVGDKYQNGDKLYLYYFDELVKKVLRIGTEPLEVKNGYIEYTITHCSTYFVMEGKLTNIQMDETSLENASVSVLDNDFSVVLATNSSEPDKGTNETKPESPITDDEVHYGVCSIMIVSGVMVLWMLRRRNMVK